MSHSRVPHPDFHISHEASDRLADRVAGWFGSMHCFYLLLAWQFGWMALATAGVWWFAGDRFPFPFLLFTGNLVQLFALPLLGVATNRAQERQRAKADADHEALSHIATQLDLVAGLLITDKR